MTHAHVSNATHHAPVATETNGTLEAPHHVPAFASPQSESSIPAWGRSSGSSSGALRHSADQLDTLLASQAASPEGCLMRKTRKAELVACVLGHTPGGAPGNLLQGPGLLLDLELREQQLAGMMQHQSSRRVMLESWLTEVLAGCSSRQQQDVGSSCSSRGGAADFGLTRPQLVAAGLSTTAVDALYRSMFVYSGGFVDEMKELLGGIRCRQALLSSVWRAYLLLAEHAMKASFKSDYLALVTAAGSAANELLFTKQALSKVRLDNAAMVKDLGSLSAAEAEATALRRRLKAQVEDLQAALALEQTAHRRAVQQYVDALDARSAMALQLQDAQHALAELQASHDALQRQHTQLQQQHAGLIGQCRVVRDVCQRSGDALGLDQQLAQQVQQWQEQQPKHDGDRNEQPVEPANASESAAAAGSNGSTSQDFECADLQPLAERLDRQVQAMCASWRSAVDARDAALTERFRMADQLRDTQEAGHQATQQQGVLQRAWDEAQQQLAAGQAHAADLDRRLTAAHESLAQHQLDLGDCQGHLQHTRNKAAALDKRCSQLQECVQQLREVAQEQQACQLKLEAQLTAAGQRLATKQRVLCEISKGLAVSMTAAWANQTARRVSDRQLAAERSRGAHMNSSLASKDVLLHDLNARGAEAVRQLEALRSDVALMEAAMQDSQRQAMSLGSRLTLTEARNDELLGQTQTQFDQLSEASTRISKQATKLELAKQQAERAARDIRELRDAAQVSERMLGEARLQAGALAADVERLGREKQAQADRAEATKARLELEVHRLSGELSAASRKLELLASDLAAERDRVAATAAVLERKRGKKRRWKEAHSASANEVAALHTQLLSQHKELEGLEARLRQLHIELRLLGVVAATSSTGGGEAAVSSRRPRSGVAGNSSRPGSACTPTSLGSSVAALQEARQAHEAAASDVAQANASCLEQDQAIEQLELQQQCLLLSLASPALDTKQLHEASASAASTRQVLQGLRQQRQEQEQARGAAAARLRAADAQLRAAHQARVKQRQQLLQAQAVQASDLVNAAALAQVVAAEEAEAAARDALTAQLDAFEAAQADKANLSERMEQLQAGIQHFTHCIACLEGDKAQLGGGLTKATETITCLQAEVAAINVERERVRAAAAHSVERITALEVELDTAKQASSAALKGMEAKAAAERQMHEQRLQAERAKCGRAAAAAEAAGAVLRSRVAQLRALLEDVAAQCFPHPCCSGPEAARSQELQARASSGGGGVEAAAAAFEGSSGGLQQQPSPAGERFVYLHNPASAWSRVRQLLQQREAPDGISSLSSSGASTPRGLVAGRLLGCPPCIPGLAFTHDALLVLIGELLLHKIDGDATSDDRLLLSAAAAAAGTGTHSSAASSAAPSRVASRPTMAAAAGSSNGGGALTAAAATAAAHGMLAAVPEDGSGVATSAELKGGSTAAVAAWWSSRLRKDLEGSVYEFFLTRVGGRLVAEAHCSALVQSLRKAAGRSKRAALFGRCLGLLEPAVPPAGVGTLLHFVAQLHSTCGPLTGEATEGSSQVLARTAAKLAMQVLQPTAAPSCPEVTGLPAALASAAGGSSDDSIELDDVLALLLTAWTAQRAADVAQLTRVAGQHAGDARGLVNTDDFSGLVRQVAPLAGQHLSPEQLNWLFASGLRASEPHALAISAAGFAAAVLDAGLVGSGAHLQRHPVIVQRPPFSELRLLQTSWHAVKPALREALRSLPKLQPGLAPEVAALNSMAHNLDDAVSSGGSSSSSGPREAWALYQRILGAYSQFGSFPEAAWAPATPRDGASSSRLGSGHTTPRGYERAGSGSTSGAAAR